MQNRRRTVPSSLVSKIVFVSFFIMAFNSCKRDPALFEINNLNGNVISIFGHGGMGIGYKFPIDTYQSIEPVLRRGADGSEMDIQMTKDSVLIVYHDDDLDNQTNCPGMINDMLWSEIWGCHFSSPISSKVNLTSFNDLLDDLTASGKNIYDYIFTFDCKLYSNAADRIAFWNQFANAILKAMDDYGLQNNIFIESQDTAFIRILQGKRSGLKLFFYPGDFESAFQIATAMNLYGITIHTDLISASQVKQAHDSGFMVTLWGIASEQENIDAIKKSPDFIQTDKPIHLLKFFDRYKG